MNYSTHKTETGTSSPQLLYRPQPAQLSLLEPEPAAVEFRALTGRLEDTLRQLPTVSFETTHHFVPGLYAREFFMRKGTALMSKIHRHTYLLILAQGRILMRTEQDLQVYEAPIVLPAFPGCKRAILALEDALFISTHATSETDLGKIEDECIVTDPAEWADLMNMQRPAPADWSTLPVIEEEDA